MKQPKIGWVAGLLLAFLFFMVLINLGKGVETPQTLTSGGQTPQGVLPQQGAESIPLEQQWRLVSFENLAINIDGQLYDKGTFQNQATGEVVVARCVTMDVADPNVGDIFTRNGDTFSPIGKASQTFQTFQVVTTPSPVPTITATTPAQPPEGILPSTPSAPDIGGFFDKVGKILMWAAIIIVVLIFAFLIFALGRTFFWW